MDSKIRSAISGASGGPRFATDRKAIPRPRVRRTSTAVSGRAKSRAFSTSLSRSWAAGRWAFPAFTSVGLHAFLQERRGAPTPRSMRYWAAHFVQARPIVLRTRASARYLDRGARHEGPAPVHPACPREAAGSCGRWAFPAFTSVGLHAFLQERRGPPTPRSMRYWAAHFVQARPIVLRTRASARYLDRGARHEGPVSVHPRQEDGPRLRANWAAGEPMLAPLRAAEPGRVPPRKDGRV